MCVCMCVSLCECLCVCVLSTLHTKKTFNILRNKHIIMDFFQVNFTHYVY